MKNKNNCEEPKTFDNFEDFHNEVDRIMKIFEKAEKNSVRRMKHKKARDVSYKTSVYLVDSVSGLMEPISTKEAKTHMRKDDWEQLYWGGILLIHY